MNITIKNMCRMDDRWVFTMAVCNTLKGNLIKESLRKEFINNI